MKHQNQRLFSFFLALVGASATAAMLTATPNEVPTGKVDSCSAAASAAMKTPSLIPTIDESRRQLLKDHGVTIEPLEPIGARVTGLNLTDGITPQKEPLLKALEIEMANRGFLVFPNQGVLSPKEQIAASCLWGGREMHSTHGVHRATPKDGYPHIFRLSNNPRHGTLGVGPQWHNDGSFEEGTFSHVGMHLVSIPKHGGGTHIAHQGAAFDSLPPEKQERWQRLVSVNSNSGVLHPLVHEHPITGRKCVWLHLGMSGAVIERLPEGETNGTNDVPLRLLTEPEMKELFNDYNDLLNRGMKEGYAANYDYTEGDFLVMDNLAVAHRASPEAHTSYQKQGLRILHRTTVKATQPLAPGLGLPQGINIYAPNPLNEDGVWIGSGIGFIWDETLHYQN